MVKFAGLVRGLSAAGLLAGVMGGCGEGTPATTSTTVPGRFQPLIDAVQAELVVSGATGVAVAIVEHGEATFADGFGTRHPGQVDPVRATTLFRIGSTNKMLTAIALLQTVQAGQVDLNRPVTDYVPGFHLTRTPAPAAAVTVRQLLTHTSGLADYLEVDAPPDERTDAALGAVLTGRFADLGYIQSPPGAFHAYANPGYMLVGLIAETITGMPYRQLMRDSVFTPLGMQRTFFLPSEVTADGDYARARTCTSTKPGCPWPPGIGPLIDADSYDNPWARPAGYAWSSVLDMAKVARFLLHGQPDVLGDDQRTAMSSEQVRIPDAAGLLSYGYGLVVASGFDLPARPVNAHHDLKFIWHNGGIPGYSAFMGCLPERDFCFITLASGDNAFFQASLVTALRTLVDLPPPTTPPDVAPRPDRFPAYLGHYNDPFVLGDVQVTTTDNKLQVRLPMQDSTPGPYDLMPTALDNFVATIDGTPTPVTFITDDKGVYRYLYSRPFVATRVDAP